MCVRILCRIPHSVLFHHLFSAIFLGCALIYAYSEGGLIVLNPGSDTDVLRLFRWNFEMLEGLAIFVFVFTPQLLFFPIMRPMRIAEMDRSRSLTLVWLASAVGYLLYLFVGIFGYMATWEISVAPEPNILEMMNLNLTIFQVTVVMMIINSVLNFALFGFSARESLDMFIFGRPSSTTKRSSTNVKADVSINNDEDSDIFVFDHEATKWQLVLRFVIETVMILAVSMVLALFVFDIR